MTGQDYEVQQPLLIILPLDTFSFNTDHPTKMEPDPHQVHLQHFQLLQKERQRKNKEQRNRVHQQHVQRRQEQLRHQQRFQLRLQQQQQQAVPQLQQQPLQAVPQLPILEQLQPQPNATPPNEVEEEEAVPHPKPTKPVKQVNRAKDPVVLSSTQTPDKVGQFEANASSRKICYTTTPAADNEAADRLSLMIIQHASSTAPNLDSRAASTSTAVSGIHQTVQPTYVSEVLAKSSSSSSEDTFVSISSPTATPVPSLEPSTSSSTSTSDFGGFPDIEIPPDATPTKSFPPATPKGPNRREAIKNKKSKLRQGFGALATTIIRGQPSTAAAAAAAQPQVPTTSRSYSPEPIPPPLPPRPQPHIGRIPDSCPICTDSSVFTRLSPQEIQKLQHSPNCSWYQINPEESHPQVAASRPNTRQGGVPIGKWGPHSNIFKPHD